MSSELGIDPSKPEQPHANNRERVVCVWVRCDACSMSARSNKPKPSTEKMMFDAISNLRDAGCGHTSGDLSLRETLRKLRYSVTRTGPRGREVVGVIPLAFVESGARVSFLDSWGDEFLVTTDDDAPAWGAVFAGERSCVRLSDGWLYAAQRSELVVPFDLVGGD